MPINVPNGLPAIAALEKENIFVMTEERAQTQDIRPLRIVILNLMPKKIEIRNTAAPFVGKYASAGGCRVAADCYSPVQEHSARTFSKVLSYV